MTCISNIVINHHVEVHLGYDGKLRLVKNDKDRKKAGFKNFSNQEEAEEFLNKQISKIKKIIHYQYTTLTDVSDRVKVEVHQVGMA